MNEWLVFKKTFKENAILAILFLLPWQTKLILSYEWLNSGLTQFGILSLFAVEVLLVLAIFLSRPQRFSKATAVPRALAFVILGVISIAATASIHPFVSVVQIGHLLFAMLLFFALLDERIPPFKMVTAFTLGLVVPVFFGIWQVVFGTFPASSLLGIATRNVNEAGDSVIQSASGVRHLRAYGTFSHPNIFGGYLAVALAGLFALPAYAKTAWQRRGVWLLIALMAIGLALTFSRSAWLGLILAIIVGSMAYFMKNTKLARILVVPVALVFIASSVLGGVFLGVDVRPGSDAAFEARSANERVAQYEDFPEVVSSHVFFGSGIGTYVYAVEQAFPDRSAWDYQPIHNVFLLVIAESGLLGALAVFMWSSSIDRINFARFPNRDAVAAFMMGNVILVILFFDHYLWSSWAGLALVAYVMALTVRMGEPS